MSLQIFIACQPVNLIQDKKCIPIHYRLSFQLFINSPPRWTNLAVLQTMLKLLPGSQLKLISTINFITIVDNNKIMKM